MSRCAEVWEKIFWNGYSFGEVQKGKEQEHILGSKVSTQKEYPITPLLEEHRIILATMFSGSNTGGEEGIWIQTRFRLLKSLLGELCAC